MGTAHGNHVAIYSILLLRCKSPWWLSAVKVWVSNNRPMTFRKEKKQWDTSKCSWIVESRSSVILVQNFKKSTCNIFIICGSYPPVHFCTVNFCVPSLSNCVKGHQNFLLLFLYNLSTNLSRSYHPHFPPQSPEIILTCY